MKQLDQSEGKLKAVLLDNLQAEASTASFRAQFFDSDNPNIARIPDAGTLKFIFDPENTQGKPSEWFRCVSHATVDGITTFTNVTRGLQRDATVDLTGSASRAQDWDASTTPLGVATEPHNNNLMKDYFEGAEKVPGNMSFSDITVDETINFTDSDVTIRRDGDDMKLKDLNQSEVTLSDLAAAAGTDEKVKISVNDTTSGYLNGKLVAGVGVTLTELNDGANETFRIDIPTSADYAFGTSGTDAYAIALTPALTSYVDGDEICFGADISNTGPATINVNTLGAIPIVKGNYNALETQDIFTNQQTELRLNVKSVTFTGALAIAATSGTLTGNWAYKTGVYSVLFSNGDRRDVTLTNGATSATWSGGLSAAATANATAQYAQLINYPASLVGALNGSEQHYHDFVRNNSLARRIYLYGTNSEGVASGGTVSELSGRKTVITAASNNAMAALEFYTWDLAGVSQVNTTNRNPSFRVAMSFGAATAQEGFIGWCPFLMPGTSLENSVMTLDHFGFIVQDGTLFISVADGATQTKTDISATVPSVTAGHIFEGYFDGTTATFYVDNVLVGTLNTNVPNSSMDTFRAAVIADASAAAKVLFMLSSGWVAYNET